MEQKLDKKVVLSELAFREDSSEASIRGEGEFNDMNGTCVANISSEKIEHCQGEGSQGERSK